MPIHDKRRRSRDAKTPSEALARIHPDQRPWAGHTIVKECRVWNLGSLRELAPREKSERVLIVVERGLHLREASLFVRALGCTRGWHGKSMLGQRQMYGKGGFPAPSCVLGGGCQVPELP